MVVEIKRKAYKKIKEYVNQSKEQEIGGLLCGKITKEGDLIVKNAIILKQNRSIGTFEIDEDDLMELTKNADAKFLGSIVGWWHSHGNGMAFWSTVDDDCFKRLSNLCGLCFGVVAANREKKKIFMISRLDLKDSKGRFISIDNIKPNFDFLGEFNINKKSIRKEIKKKVITTPTKYTRQYGRSSVFDNGYDYDFRNEFDYTRGI